MQLISQEQCRSLSHYRTEKFCKALCNALGSPQTNSSSVGVPVVAGELLVLKHHFPHVVKLHWGVERKAAQGCTHVVLTDTPELIPTPRRNDRKTDMGSRRSAETSQYLIMRLATLGTVKGMGGKLSTRLRLLQMKEGAQLAKRYQNI